MNSWIFCRFMYWRFFVFCLVNCRDCGNCVWFLNYLDFLLWCRRVAWFDAKLFFTVNDLRMVGDTALNCSLVLFCLVRFSVVLYGIVWFCLVLFSEFCNNILAQKAYANGILCYFSSKIALHQRKKILSFCNPFHCKRKIKNCIPTATHPVSIRQNILP